MAKYTHQLVYKGHLASTGLEPLFAFRTAFLLSDIDSTSYWLYSSETLVHIDTMALYDCFRFADCKWDHIPKVLC